MPSTIEQLNPTRVKLTIEMPFADLQPSLDRAYRQIAEQVDIPGFRKGKVPARIIDQRFGRGMVLQEAINDALPDAYGKAVNEHKLAPLGQPEVEVVKLEDGNVVEFTAEVEVRPEFEVPDLSGISVSVDAEDIDEAAISERIELLRARFATVTDVDRPAAVGDVVVIDLLGTRDGEAVEEATAEEVSYKVGAEGMLEGLDEAVTGLRAGESTVFTSTLVGGSLAGEEMDIQVTVRKVQEQELPAVDDEFAALVSPFDTVDEMVADLRANLERQAKREQAADARDKVLEEVIGKVDFDLPENLRAAEVQARREQITSQLTQAGLTLEQYLAESKEADSPEAFWADVEARSGEALKAQLLLDKIADDDQISVEQAELTQAIIRKAVANNTTPEQEANHMMEHNHMLEWMQEIRRGKALDKLIKGATVTDSAGNVLNLDELDSSTEDEEIDVSVADDQEGEAGDVSVSEADQGREEAGDASVAEAGESVNEAAAK